MDNTTAPPDWIGRVRWIWRSFVKRPALFWTGGVSYRIGSAIAASLFPTRVSPNAVTLAGLVLHGLGAAILLAAPRTVVMIVVVGLVWQVAFGLDCADGLLARSRGVSSSFGAWLDQVVDFASHVAVFGALAIVVVDASSLGTSASAALAVWVVASNSALGYSVGVRSAAQVERRNGHIDGPPTSSSVPVPLQVADYGFVLFVASLLIASPVGLGIYLVLNGVLSVALTVAQLLLYGWPARR